MEKKAYVSLVRKGAWLTKSVSALYKIGKDLVTTRKNSMQPQQTRSLWQTALWRERGESLSNHLNIHSQWKLPLFETRQGPGG